MISIVIPCLNEEAVLDQLFVRLTVAAEHWNEEWEAICVDDGSADGTWKKLCHLSERDKRWKGVRFARNFGHQRAVSAGLEHATGDAVLVIDADLQDPPEELHRFIEKWREGAEVVYAVRRKRKEVWFKRLAYYLFYRGLSCLSSTPIPLDSGDFCLMDRRVVNMLCTMPEQNRFLRGMRAWVGFHQVGLEYERHRRAAGEPQYTFRKLVRLAMDGVLSFSTIPLRLATFIGLIVLALACLATTFVLLQSWFAGSSGQFGQGTVTGFAILVIALMYLAGIQFVSIGILGEYVGRIYDEVRSRPLWIAREKVGFDDDRSQLVDGGKGSQSLRGYPTMRKAS